MSTGVITSFTLIDFLNESEMTAFFVFMEKHTDALASELRANGMTKSYVTRVFDNNDRILLASALGQPSFQPSRSASDWMVTGMA